MKFGSNGAGVNSSSAWTECLCVKSSDMNNMLQGMEPEIQRLIGKHKAELETERDKSQAHTR